jgi:4-amino-4-deoxy-L-arabinose transferase-like glycosyltransferase
MTDPGGCLTEPTASSTAAQAEPLRQQTPPDWNRREVITCIVIFFLALFVRAVYLYESSGNPTFISLTLDSRDYFLRAQNLATQGTFDAGFFWQPVFYPLAMAVLFLFSGPSVLCAKLLQIVLGALTCVLTYRLGREILDRRIGLLAGAIVAFYGPLIFYECEIDTAGWAAFWSVLFLMLLLKTATRGSPAFCLAMGACGALCTLTRPTFLPFVLVGFAWLAMVFLKSRVSRREMAGRLARVAAGFLIVVVPVAIECYRAAGHYGILPTSGGLNLHLGNNEDTCRTLTIRPGWAWDELTLQPEREGLKTKAEQSRYFYGRVWNYAKDQPLSFLLGLGHKGLQIANGREIPRNVDIYLFRDWSRVLGVLVWKVGRFGFPWGVLFPLAIVGLVWRWRQIPAPVILFVGLYLLGIVLVFVADRYRLPVVPVLSILAAAGCMGIIDMVRVRRWLSLSAACCAMVAMVVITNLPGPSCEEKVNYPAEMCTLLAQNAEEAGKISDARRLYERALSLQPDSALAHFRLGNVLANAGELDAAISHFDASLRQEANDSAYYNRGRAYAMRRDSARALSDLDKAIELRPDCAACYCRRAEIYSDMGHSARARSDWEKSLEISSSGPDAEVAKQQLKLMGLRKP